MMPIHLQAIDLSCTRQQRPLFAGLSFDLQPGQVILVEGENGAGKSSLLRLLVGLATPAVGAVHWRGRCIRTVREEYIPELHYVGHSNGIKLGLTVAENLRLISENVLNSRPSPTRGRMMEDFLKQFCLTDYKNTLAKNLSAGQQRKIALLKLLISPKPLWILDEPFTALDTASQTLFVSLLEKHLQAGGMCVMSSHHAIHFQQVTPISLRLSP